MRGVSIEIIQFSPGVPRVLNIQISRMLRCLNFPKFFPKEDSIALHSPSYCHPTVVHGALRHHHLAAHLTEQIDYSEDVYIQYVLTF